MKAELLHKVVGAKKVRVTISFGGREHYKEHLEEQSFSGAGLQKYPAPCLEAGQCEEWIAVRGGNFSRWKYTLNTKGEMSGFGSKI